VVPTGRRLITQAAFEAGAVEVPGMRWDPSSAVMVSAAVVTLLYALGLLLTSAYLFFLRDID